MSKQDKEILSYCAKHIDHMWAAVIAGIILGCDFRDSKSMLIELKYYVM